MEEARRLASMQKKRELKAAGIEMGSKVRFSIVCYLVSSFVSVGQTWIWWGASWPHVPYEVHCFYCSQLCAAGNTYSLLIQWLRLSWANGVELKSVSSPELTAPARLKQIGQVSS